MSFSTAKAQLLPVHPITQNELPSEVYSLLQDHRGQLWFSSDHGLYEYDGYDFKVWTTADGLPDNTVFRLYEDPLQRLWGTTLSGQLFYIESGRVVVPEWMHQLKGRFDGFSIRDLWIDSLATVHFFLTSSNALYRVQVDGNPTVTIENLDAPNWDGNLIYLLPSNEKRVLIESTWPPLEVMKSHSGKLEIAPPTAIRQKGRLLQFQYNFTVSRPQQRHNSLNLGDGKLLFSINNTIYLYKDNKVSLLKVLPGAVLQLYTDAAHGLWICTDNGAFYFPHGDLSLSGTHFFPQKLVSGVLQDREGNTWFAVMFEGVFRLASLDLQWLSSSTGMPFDKVDALLAMDSSLLVASEGDLFEVYQNGTTGLKVEKRAVPNQKRGDIYDMVALNKTTVLLANGDCFRYDRKTRKMTRIFFSRSNPNSKKLFVHKIFSFTAHDLLLIGPHAAALARLDPVKDTILLKDMLYFPELRSSAVTRDSSGKFWLGASDGLYELRTVPQLELKAVALGEAGPVRVSDLKVDSKGFLWVATRGKGTAVLQKGKVIQWFNEDSGLLSNLSDRLFFPEHNKTWTASSAGINELVWDGNKGRYTYSPEKWTSIDGFINLEITDMKPWQNQIAVGTAKGLHLFQPTAMKSDFVPPTISITAIRINEQDTLLKSGARLAYNQNNLEIDYSGHFFRQPEGLEYRYRLLGLEKEWHTTHERRIHYSNLSAGTYTFEVQSIQKEGGISPVAAQFAFEVRPHFSATWGFRIMISLALLLAIWGVTRWIIHTRLRKSELEKQIVLREQKALRAQMNPHFIFNTMNSIQQFIAVNDKRSAYGFLSRSAQLIRRVLENSSQNYLSLDQELASLKLYLELENMRFGERFSYAIEVEPELEAKTSEIRLPNMLIQPYVENAIWHGLMPKETGERELHLNFWLKEDHLIVSIEDNGVGREKASTLKQVTTHRQKSTAMENIKERTQLLKQLLGLTITIAVLDLYDSDQQPAGTRIQLSIPPIP